MAIQALNEDLNIIGGLFIPELEQDLDVIQKLDDEPNDVGGLTPAQLKAKFDEAGNRIKTYLNETLLPAVSDTVAEHERRREEQLAWEESEGAREEQERARLAAEEAREQAEEARREAETLRETAEGLRESKEGERLRAETARAYAEKLREHETSGIVAQARSQAERAAQEASEAQKRDAAAQEAKAQAQVSAQGAAVAAAQAAEAEAGTAQKSAQALESCQTATEAAQRAELAQSNAAAYEKSARELVEGTEGALAGKLDAQRAEKLLQSLTCQDGVLLTTALDGSREEVDVGVNACVKAGRAGNASEIRFSDGDTMQQKLDRGELNGRDGISVSLGGMFSLRVDERGHLMAAVADGGEEPPVSINAEGHLIYRV